MIKAAREKALHEEEMESGGSPSLLNSLELLEEQTNQNSTREVGPLSSDASFSASYKVRSSILL